ILISTLFPTRRSSDLVQSFSPAFGYQNTFTLPARPESKVKEQTASPAIQSHLLFDESAIFTELNKKINTNYHIYAIEIEEKSSRSEEHTSELQSRFDI